MSSQVFSNSIPLRYRPTEIEITADAPFQNDRLGREAFVTAVTELLRTIQEPFVIAMNAPWGSGKTTTLRMLEPNLNAASITTVSFNAWEVDYATDPLVPLVATLHDRLLEVKGYGSGINHDKVERLKKLGGAIAKYATTAAVKVATAGLVDLGSATDGVAKALGEATEKAGESLTNDVIDIFKQERQAAQQFRSLLYELTAFVRATAAEGMSPPPLVLLIDELDRCRPTFAIAMLERIKHFFQIPGLVFVLALDLEQLKASTHKVYGVELDATEYLRRFIDLELRLPQADMGKMVSAMLTSCGADAFFDTRTKYAELREDRSWIVDVLKSLALHFDLSARVVQSMISRLMLVVRQTSENQYLDPIIVVVMIFLRIKDENLLRGFVIGRISANDVMEALRTANPRGQQFYDSYIGKLVEAQLLYAHNERHKYVEEFLEKVKALNGQNVDAKSRRMIEVAGLFERVRGAYFRRGWFDLRAIDQRINLVAAELNEER